MKVVAIVSEKGGAGKTTVTVHLAVAAQLAGLDVAIVDLDPQASATEWADQRGSAPEAVAILPARARQAPNQIAGERSGLSPHRYPARGQQCRLYRRPSRRLRIDTIQAGRVRFSRSQENARPLPFSRETTPLPAFERHEGRRNPS
jgi:hypothetical protein